jgi:hypothetical protein
MASEWVKGLTARVAGVLGDSGAGLVPQVEAGLALVEQHGDGQALSMVAQKIEAICQALESGDAETATAIMSEFGPLAAAFGVELDGEAFELEDAPKSSKRR